VTLKATHLGGRNKVTKEPLDEVQGVRPELLMVVKRHEACAQRRQSLGFDHGEAGWVSLVSRDRTSARALPTTLRALE